MSGPALAGARLTVGSAGSVRKGAAVEGGVSGPALAKAQRGPAFAGRALAMSSVGGGA